MSLGERLARCRAEIDALKARIDTAKLELQNGGLATVTLPRKALGPPPSKRRSLAGHFNKVYALDWAADSVHLVSAAQDGKLIYWNAITRNKLQVIPLKPMWVMTCALEPTASRLLASGGLDNICSIYSLDDGGGSAMGSSKPRAELHGHEGYLSSCKFTDPRHVLTASGDSTCIFWDVEKRREVSRFTEHASDVTSIAVHPTDRSVFVSGSADATVKMWDVRAPGRCQATFIGHEGDVNAVAFMPNGLAFGSGGDDGCARIFDMRSYARVNEALHESSGVALTALDFSASGRLLFAGYEDGNVYAWDALVENPGSPSYVMAGHTGRLSCLAVAKSGQALATGAWDAEIAVWA